MLSVDEALAHILATITPLSPENVNLAHGFRRVLATDIVASLDLPPFDNSSMDGYAVIAADLEGATPDNPISLIVVEDIPAGHYPQKTIHRGQAARIMTGAPLPQGANAVAPIEITNVVRNTPTFSPDVTIYGTVSAASNIRRRGEDIRHGEVILPRGRVLRAADVGVLAGLGYAEISVVRHPRVAVISTGDELVAPNMPLTEGKIRDMNGYTIPALIEELGATPLRMGIVADSTEAVEAIFREAAGQEADLIVSSAGVSVGAFDVVKTVLERLGKVNFWKVNMRPGKPLTFGTILGIPFLGLPGNPVSAMVTFDVFARPMLLQMMGLPLDLYTQQVRLGENINSDGRTTFARVRLERENGELIAYSTGTQSSGALSSMVKADGLLIIPAGTHEAQKGDLFTVRLLNRY